MTDSARWPQPPLERRYETNRNIRLLTLSMAVAAQGRLVEAEAIARQGLLYQLKSQGRYAPETGLMLLGLAATVLEQGRFADAERLARASVDIYEQLGHGPGSVSFALTRNVLAEALSAQARWAEALQQ